LAHGTGDDSVAKHELKRVADLSAELLQRATTRKYSSQAVDNKKGKGKQPFPFALVENFKPCYLRQADSPLYKDRIVRTRPR
jgi:hypothetical protein